MPPMASSRGLVDVLWASGRPASAAGPPVDTDVVTVGPWSIGITLVVTAVAALATSRRRPVKTTLVGLLVVVILLAWGFFAVPGLPLANEYCPGGEPAWWPGWLPPAAGTY